MEFTAAALNVRVSPRKARLVADAVRGLPVTVAMDKVVFSPGAKVFRSRETSLTVSLAG